MTMEPRDLVIEILRRMEGDLGELKEGQRAANRSMCDVLRRQIRLGLKEARRGELVDGTLKEILDGIDRELDAADERAARKGRRGSPR